ncbi:four helix bundle protein [Aquimarina hainanensis]|uniref:Four helix bundle protein n=1 Tax=Aquimarina hainanensis TaxID=1578017 RepID=A0ABW5N6W0_9FLAO|nr:four helix bundle protein [Aquimarina sp. TRL1]QKX03931.1 four helix bundle protein [Aquimarina sp. TRL1]
MKSEFQFKFEELTIYDKAIDFGEAVYKQIQTFPKEELHLLTARFSKAADDLAVNIANGAMSNDVIEFMTCLQLAYDEAHDCIVCSTKAKLRGYISAEQDEKNRMEVTELAKMLQAYQNHLQSKHGE